MTKRISKDDLRDYFSSVFYKPRVIAYVQKASKLTSAKKKPKMLRDYTPKMVYSRIPGGRVLKNAAGVCKGCNDIRIADWILVDSVEVKATVRHELAHALNNYKHGMHGRPHGKEFIEAL